VRFLAHPEPCHQLPRRHVRPVRAADDAVQAQLFERHPQHLHRGFARVPVPVVARVEDEPDLAAAVLGRQPAQIHLPHQLALVLDGEHDAVAFLLDRRVFDAVLQRPLGLLARPRLPQQEAGHLGEAVVGVQRVDVGLGELAEDQAVGPDRIIGFEHVRQATRPGACGPTV
jgi:hypothetical protein